MLKLYINEQMTELQKVTPSCVKVLVKIERKRNIWGKSYLVSAMGKHDRRMEEAADSEERSEGKKNF